MIDRLLVAICAGLLLLGFVMKHNSDNSVSETTNYRPAIVSPDYLGMKK